MKKQKYIALLCAIVIGATSMVSTQVNAATTFSVSKSGFNYFEKAWEKTNTYFQNEKEIASMVYGFDTWAIDEDYVWTKANECYSTARVKRATVDSKWIEGSEKGKNKYSKIEVTHKNTWIYYGIELSATYVGDISVSTESTNAK